MGIGISLRGGGLIAPAMEERRSPCHWTRSCGGWRSRRPRSRRPAAQFGIDGRDGHPLNLGDDSADMVLPVTIRRRWRSSAQVRSPSARRRRRACTAKARHLDRRRRPPRQRRPARLRAISRPSIASAQTGGPMTQNSGRARKARLYDVAPDLEGPIPTSASTSSSSSTRIIPSCCGAAS